MNILYGCQVYLGRRLLKSIFNAGIRLQKYQKITKIKGQIPLNNNREQRTTELQEAAEATQESIQNSTSENTEQENLESVCEKQFVGQPSRLARHMREVHAKNRFEKLINT